MTPKRYFAAILLLVIPLTLSILRVKHECESFLCSSPVESEQTELKKVIGPLATIEETETNLSFTARVDTGAGTSSIHAAEWTVPEAGASLMEDVGKTIRFRLENQDGGTAWIERIIAGVKHISTSEGTEMRYLVPITINHEGRETEVQMTLNDRSHMRYPILLGRNFLSGKYIVDVEDSHSINSNLVAKN